MHCVNCGSSLHGENQAGLICQPCKQERGKSRKSWEQPIYIQYCFRCGRLYHPHDTSIQHLFCPGEEIRLSISSLFSHSRETIQEARKNTYVLL